MRYKYTSSPEVESQQQERLFEKEFGRPMTIEEKKLYSLSAEFLENVSKYQPAVRVERRLHLRIMPSW